MNLGGAGPGDEEPASPPTSASGRLARRRNVVWTRLSQLGASAQSAIPGLYAWSITVAPAAWSRGAPIVAKVAALCGVIALVTAPFIEAAGLRRFEPGRSPVANWARIWSVWGFVLSSAMVWMLAPGALSSARFDGVRGALGVVGWALFAFASAGPSLRTEPDAGKPIVVGSALKPRSVLPRGDNAYVAVGIVVALAMQGVGWGVPTPERAVLVRLVTIVCGVAVINATTSIALSRHAIRRSASRRLRVRRALPWVAMVALLLAVGFVLLSTFPR